MSDSAGQVQCRCGETMEPGYATALGLFGVDHVHDTPQLVFVVSGERTSANPLKALKQGLDEAPKRRAFRLRGYRCPACGRVELLAVDKIPWEP